MKIRAAVFCLAVAACAVAQQVPKKVYRVETSAPKDIRMEVVHGETINLQWTFLSYANPLDIESAAVTLHARTNGMPEGVSFQVPGAAGPGGVATVRLAVSEWLPASVSEAEWTLEVVQPDAARILRAKGTVTATRSAAASTNDPVPVVWLDDIRAEIGGEVGPLRSRLNAVEDGTNRWEQAFAWGYHGAMGYLLPVALNNYYTIAETGQKIAEAVAALPDEQDLAALAALAAYADTNKVTRLWGESGQTYALADGTLWQLRLATNYARAFTNNIAPGSALVETSPGSLHFTGEIERDCDLLYRYDSWSGWTPELQWVLRDGDGYLYNSGADETNATIIE